MRDFACRIPFTMCRGSTGREHEAHHHEEESSRKKSNGIEAAHHGNKKMILVPILVNGVAGMSPNLTPAAYGRLSATAVEHLD